MLSTTFCRFLRGFDAFKNDSEFKEKAADVFYDLADLLSAKYESMGDDFIVDAQDESLSLAAKQKRILLSRQTPSHQIWVATPISGSLKFDYDSDQQKWFDHKRQSVELTQWLQDEIVSVIKAQ